MSYKNLYFENPHHNVLYLVIEQEPTLRPVSPDDLSLYWLLDPAMLEGREFRIVPIKNKWPIKPCHAMRQLISRKCGPRFRQCQTKPRKCTEAEGQTGIFTSHTVWGDAWRANKYDGMLKDACQLSGYPVAFASHDLQLVVVMVVLSYSSKCCQPNKADTVRIRLEEVQYAIGHSICSDKWTHYMNRTSSVDFQRAIHGISTTLYVCL